MIKNKKITIGIWSHTDSTRIQKTLDSIRQYTHRPFKLVLMADKTDITALNHLSNIPQLFTNQSLDAAACFNRLISYDDADVVVFLESGCLVTSNWLERLLDALNKDTQYGLAGPSTNVGWNEQRHSDSPGTEALAQVVEEFASHMAERHQGDFRSLEPLHSLSDFCYVVKREVIEAIGRADENYGTGPCWEMDYNIRAARAGFKGIWVCDAYVHRLPVAVKRTREETRLMEVNKRHYQDKFCLLKLKKKKQDYCRHCKGDGCECFAPGKLIQIYLPIDRDGKRGPGTRQVGLYSVQPKVTHCSFKHEIRNPKPEIADLPPVSCIMPTHNRRVFAAQAIKYYLRQNYPKKELIIVDDGTEPIQDLVPDDPDIRYLHLGRKKTVGAKRNLACSEAKGEIIVHWDDDDWMAPWRINYQVENLLSEKADICGLDRLFYYDPDSNQSWQYIYLEGRKKWIAGGTLCYKKAFWDKNPFPDSNVGEDTQFVWRNCSKKMLTLKDSTFYVAMIHRGNTSPKVTTSNLWHSYPTEKISEIIGSDWAFYVDFIKDSNNFPLISCIMPTHNRRLFVPQAIKYFLRQDYPNKELIIVDDGTDEVADIVPNDERIKYIPLSHKVSIGYKRNIAGENSKGEIIAHWDDDDWYHLSYLRSLTKRLLQSNEIQAISGLSVYLIYILENSVLKICRTGGIAGATFCYFKTLWEKSPYRDVDTAEDYFFLQDAKPRLVHIENPELFIVVRHKYNTWKEERGIDINRYLHRLGNYSKDLYEIADISDYRFYELARSELYKSPCVRITK